MYLDKIYVQKDFVLDDIIKSVRANFDRIMLGSLSREEYGEQVYHTPTLRDLPFGHLRNHCVLCPQGTVPQDPDTLTRHLRHMLVAPKKKDDAENRYAENLIAGAVRLSPDDDASDFWKLREQSQAFYDACIRGDLSQALLIVRDEQWEPDLESRATAMVGRMLLYHLTLQTQLIAARAWRWNLVARLSGKDDKILGRHSSILQDWIAVTETVLKAANEFKGNSKPGPKSAAFKRFVEQNEALKAYCESKKGDKELEEELKKLMPEIIKSAETFHKYFTWMRSSARTGKTGKRHGNLSMHAGVTGLSRAEAIAFAAIRLIQFRDGIDAIIAAAFSQRTIVLPSYLPEKMVKACKQDVSAILLVYRHLHLEDCTLSPKATNRRNNLEAIISDAEARGNEPNDDILKNIYTDIRAGRFKRDVYGGGLVLRQAQYVDLLPEPFFANSATEPPKPSPMHGVNERHAKNMDNKSRFER